MIFRKIDESERRVASRLQAQSFHFKYDPERKRRLKLQAALTSTAA